MSVSVLLPSETDELFELLHDTPITSIGPEHTYVVHVPGLLLLLPRTNVAFCLRHIMTPLYVETGTSRQQFRRLQVRCFPHVLHFGSVVMTRLAPAQDDMPIQIIRPTGPHHHRRLECTRGDALSEHLRRLGCGLASANGRLSSV